MIIYYVGIIIAMGFFIGIYWPDQGFHNQCYSISETQDKAVVLKIAITGIVALTSWIGIVAMIAHQAYIRDKKEWNI